jgi:hypothetical protein
MSLNGIAHLPTREDRQKAKLAIAEAKRQGKVVAADGTITGNVDDTKPYYRSRNILDITQLPTQFDGNNIIDNANVDGLVEGRPWIDIGQADANILTEDGDNLITEGSDTLITE